MLGITYLCYTHDTQKRAAHKKSHSELLSHDMDFRHPKIEFNCAKPHSCDAVNNNTSSTNTTRWGTPSSSLLTPTHTLSSPWVVKKSCKSYVTTRHTHTHTQTKRRVWRTPHATRCESHAPWLARQPTPSVCVFFLNADRNNKQAGKQHFTFRQSSTTEIYTVQPQHI